MGEPLAARLGLWRVTRRDAVRNLYQRLASDAAYFAQLDRFERPTASPPEVPDAPVDRYRDRTVAEADRVPEYLRDEPLAPGDRILTAVRDGELVGVVCTSDRPVYVPELHSRETFPGPYLWRLYVPPAERRQGIATALAARVVRSAAELGADRVVALVGPDNLPSRKAFRTLGFSPTRRYTAAGLLGWEYDRRTDLADDAG